MVIHFSLRNIILTSAVLLFMGCASMDVNVEHDESVDFSLYKEYFWSGERKSGYDYIDNWIRDTIRQNLDGRGYRLREIAPDFLVGFSAEKETILMPGWSTAEEDQLTGSYAERWSSYSGTLLIEMFDAATLQTIWKGRARTDLMFGPVRRNSSKAIDMAVFRLLSRFPPPADE